MLLAVTFDFWDTLVADDSDEPKRAALGLPPKPTARLRLLTDEITRHHPDISPERVKAAFDHANERFRHFWKVEHHTPAVPERLQLAYDFLGIPPTPGFGEIVRAVEDMEVEVPPQFVPGVDALAELARDYKLGIVSDTIHTPGRGIRQLLESRGLLRHFSYLIFSDEVGASKPNPLVFQRASAGLGVPLESIAHVGDRESNDVDGPLALGMKAVLYTGAVDRDSASTRAHAVCSQMADLPGIIRHFDR